jgi:energy-coupling factor transport system substrate-specific component
VLTRIITALAIFTFSPFGWSILWMAVIFGLACEIAFAVKRYRNFRWPVVCVAGAIACLVSYAMMAVFGFFPMSALGQVGVALAFIVSGVLLGGLLALALVNAIAKTGVLNSFAVGQARREDI